MAFWKRLLGREPARGVARQPAALGRPVSGSAPSSGMAHHSTKLHRGAIPEFCFVGAPFGGSVPNDLGSWAKDNQALAAASLLGIEDPNQFEQLQARLDAKTKTILVPDASADEILGDCDASGSLKQRAMLVMEHRLRLVPAEWECLPMAYLKDGLDRCSPVGILFVFKKT
ncbi:MAG: hypothetical protein ACT4PU_08430 [Planctomycetota bacterium]